MQKLSVMHLKNNKENIKKILSELNYQNLELLKTINQGLFNGVVVARNNKLGGRLESIKFLDSVEPHEKSNFLREGKILGCVKHRNIPRVYDILEYNDMFLYRFEHIEGFTLREVLDELGKKNEKLPASVATSIILKLLDALRYVHNDIKYKAGYTGVVHGDIKPSNIIISAGSDKTPEKLNKTFLEMVRNGDVEPFLIDFGIAKFQGETTEQDGTLNYRSPMQCHQGNKVSWRSDLHQLLLVFSEMLTGTKPFEGKKRQDIIKEKTESDFKVPKTNINKKLKEFIEKGTLRDETKSFDSEKQAAEKLRKIHRKLTFKKWFNEYKKPIVGFVAIFLLVSFLVAGFRLWDYHVNSTDAIVEKIQKNPDPSLAELNIALKKIQERGFEKKYLEPLKRGEFRNSKTGEPMYPSHLDTNGDWVLVGADENAAGSFVGMLFEQSRQYPEALGYAKEYAKPLLESEFDGSSSRRFAHGLIPAYEVTGNDIYLDKLTEVAELLKQYFKMRDGMYQTADLYHGELFMGVYNKTGNRSYKHVFEEYMREFAKHNIRSDGFVFEYSQINATRPDGTPLPDNKGAWFVETTQDYELEKMGFISDKKIKE